MDSRFGGVAALLITGGAFFWAATSLGDYFAERNTELTAAVEQMAGQAVEAVETATDTVGEVVGDAVGTATQAVSEAVETATDTVVDAVTDAGEEASSAADGVVEDTESATEEAVEDMVAALVPDATSQEAETLESLGHDMAEEAQPEGTTPVLDIVRVEPSGDTLIAGNAPEGERVGLIYNNEMVAEADVEPSGDFVLVPDAPLPSGEGTLEIVTINEDGDTLMRSDEQVAIVLPDDANEAGFLVGVLRPGEPVEIIEREAPADTDVATQEAVTEEVEEVELAATEPTETTEPTQPLASDEMPSAGPAPFVLVDAIELEGQSVWIAGGALPGTIVRLYQDNEVLGEALTGPEGRFLFEGELADATGEVVIRADALAAGTANVLARAQVPFDMPVFAQAEADPAPEADPVEVAAAQPTSEPEPATETAPQTATEPAAAPAATEAEAEAEAAQAAPAEPAEEAVSTVTAAASEPAPEPASEPVRVVSANERVSVLDGGQVIIRRGDNLWRLSRRVFGQGIRYTSIYDANRDQIQNPALIFPGQVFEVPEADREWGSVPGLQALDQDQVILPQE